MIAMPMPIVIVVNVLFSESPLLPEVVGVGELLDGAPTTIEVAAPELPYASSPAK
jgi:hypothetical protein